MGAAGWARVVEGFGVSPCVGLRFRCDYGVQRRCGVGARLVQRHGGSKGASSTPSCNRSDSYGGDTTALASRERSIGSKDVTPVVATAHTNKSKHHKPKARRIAANIAKLPELLSK